jgi:general secretion pathway protein A
VLTVAQEHTASNGYERQFGLVERPFSLTPDTRFLFESRSHAEAYDHVIAALRQREALVVITGEVGAGKTMLCQTVLKRLKRRTLLSNITNPLLTGDDLLAQILNDFGTLSKRGRWIGDASPDSLNKTLQRFLASLVPSQVHAVVIIDEAQHLRFDAFEAIRLLLSAETGISKLLHVVLVGQPHLTRVLSRPEMRQLNQRVSRRYELGSVRTREVQQYIERRLWIGQGGAAQCLGVRPAASAAPEREEPAAGGEQFWRVRFSPSAIRAIADISGGLPRVINVICDRALELVSEKRTDSIDTGTVLWAARQLHIRIPAASRLRSNSYLGFAASILVITGLGWWGGGLRPRPRLAAVQQAAANRRGERSASEAVRATAAAAAAYGYVAPETVALPESESFTIVVASFPAGSRAAELATELEKQHLPAFTDDVSGEGRHVIIGPYASRAEAEDVQRQLAAGRLTGSRILSSIRSGMASSTRLAGR